jgi:hypothetical protein
MTTASQITAAGANRRGEHASEKRSELRWISQISAVARALWPTKTALNLASHTNVSERAAEFWLAGKYDMSLAAARELLRSEHGYEFLTALVGDDCEALWFRRAKLAHEVGITSRAIRAQEKRVEKLRAQRRQIEMFDSE